MRSTAEKPANKKLRVARGMSIAAVLLLLSMAAVQAQDDIKKEAPSEAVTQKAKKEQLQYYPEQRDELSCSKQARRLHKLADKEKRRQFIAECRAQRETRQRTEMDKKSSQELKQKEANQAIQRGEL